MLGCLAEPLYQRPWNEMATGVHRRANMAKQVEVFRAPGYKAVHERCKHRLLRGAPDPGLELSAVLRVNRVDKYVEFLLCGSAPEPLRKCGVRSSLAYGRTTVLSPLKEQPGRR